MFKANKISPELVWSKRVLKAKLTCALEWTTGRMADNAFELSLSFLRCTSQFTGLKTTSADCNAMPTGRPNSFALICFASSQPPWFIDVFSNYAATCARAAYTSADLRLGLEMKNPQAQRTPSK